MFTQPNILALRLMVVALCMSLHVPGARAASERSAFHLSTEFYGPLGYANPDAALNLQNGMANMVAFWPPADVGMQRFVMSHVVRLNFHLQGATRVDNHSAASIESQRLAASRICLAQPASLATRRRAIELLARVRYEDLPPPA